MFAIALFTALLGSSLAFAGPVANGTVPRLCGSDLSDDRIAANEAHFAANVVEKSAGLVANANFVVPVVWHIIKRDSSTGSLT